MSLDKLAVGILAAAASGSELTQATLDTFHSSGNLVEIVTTGVSRIQDCLNNSNTLAQILFTIDVPPKCKLPYLKMSMLMDEEVVLVRERPAWFDSFESRFGPISLTPIIVVIKIPLAKQLQYGFTFKDIQCEHESPLSPIPLAVSPATVDDGKLVSLLAIGFQVERQELVNMCSSYYGYLPDAVDTVITVKILRHVIFNWYISGIKSVERTARLDNGKTLILCNSFASIYDFILLDPVNIICNKTIFMLQVYGVEVARACLIQELTSTMSKILPCHIITIIDVMTWSGKITSISRYSVRKELDVFKRISFEEATCNTRKACIECERDDLKSVSSRIVASKLLCFQYD